MDYSRLRQRVLKRDGFRCRMCGAEATEVDHIRSVVMGGADTEANLWASCRSCNAHKAGHSSGPPIHQGEEPDCSHCHIGKRMGSRPICRACYTYERKYDRLPPQRLIDRRLENLVAYANPGNWVATSQKPKRRGKRNPVRILA